MFDKELTVKHSIAPMMPVSAVVAPIESRKSSLNFLKEEKNGSSLALRPMRKDSNKLYDEIGKDSFRKRQA